MVIAETKNIVGKLANLGNDVTNNLKTTLDANSTHAYTQRRLKVDFLLTNFNKRYSLDVNRCFPVYSC